MNNEIIITNNLDEFISRKQTIEGSSLIIRCIKGKMQININDSQFEVKEDDLLICNPSFIINNYMRTPDFSCQMMVIPPHSFDEVAYLCIREDSRWWEKTQYLSSHPIIHLDERQSKLTDIFLEIYRIYHNYDLTPERERILKVITQASICEILSWVGELLKFQEKPNISHKNAIFLRFVELLRSTNGTERQVQWYAAELAVTPKYLSSICKEISGKSASEIINEVTLQTIKRLLQSTDLSAKEICAKMNFSNLSFFCKYIKHHLGMNTSEYRKMVR